MLPALLLVALSLASASPARVSAVPPAKLFVAAPVLPAAPGARFQPGGSDSCATPTVIGGSGSFAYDTVGATSGSEGQAELNCYFFGATTIDSDVWFRWTPDFSGTARMSLCAGGSGDPKIAVYSALGCPSDGTSLACSDDYCGLLSEMEFPVAAGFPYLLQVGTFPGGATSAGTFDIGPPPSPPGHDDCATPASITGSGVFGFDSTLATMGSAGQFESICYDFGSTSLDNDLWYAWTADFTGQAELLTCASTNVDTKLAVWPGGGCPLDGTALACNDDHCGLQSTVIFPVAIGATYLLQVGTFPGASGGPGSFTIGPPASPPTSDECALADAIVGSGDFAFSTLEATTGLEGQNESLCYYYGSTQIHNDVWFEWTADFTGTAILSLCAGATVDTKIAAYAGTSCPLDGSALACNDDACGLQSELQFPAIAGNTYMLQVGHFSGSIEASGYISLYSADCDIQILTQPASATVCAGGGASFTVLAQGVNLAYQWQRDASPIPGATASIYSIPSVNTGHSGGYSVIVSNSCDSVTSSVATLTVQSAPAITLDPLSESVCVGDNYTFTAAATGNPAPSYQWYRNDNALPRATSSNLALTDIQDHQKGLYHVVASTACGEATSATAQLIVDACLPQIGIQPQPCDVAITRSTDTLCVDQAFEFRARGVPPGGTFAWDVIQSHGQLTPSAGAGSKFDVRAVAPSLIEHDVTLRVTYVAPNGTSCQDSTPLTSARCAPLPRMPLGGKNRRVDLHGVPVPERGPLGEGERDRQSGAAYVDMYDLAPQYSKTDVSIALEGGELALELRRSAGLRSFRHSSNPAKRGITYPTDFLMGLGWDTNLSSRAVLAFDDAEPDQQLATTIRVVDEVGTAHDYFDRGESGMGSSFTPNLTHSFLNEAVNASLQREDASTLVLTRVFGTRLVFKLLGRTLPPLPQDGSYEDYYRLESVEDRNGNRIELLYSSSDIADRSSFLVEETREGLHPLTQLDLTARRLRFEYALGNGPVGVDRGDRLIAVIDPLDGGIGSRRTTYHYGVADGMAWDLLLRVEHELVEDAEKGGALARPTIHFGYRTAELPVELTRRPPLLPRSDPELRKRVVGPSTMTDARGHSASFSYVEDFFPTAIDAAQNLWYAQTLRLDGVATIDGAVVLGQEQRDEMRVLTSAIDTAGHAVSYDFGAEFAPLDNPVGVGHFVTSLARRSESLAQDDTVSFEWSADPYANLLRVVDLFGNPTEYEYGDLGARRSDQPTLRRRIDATSGGSIVEHYEYGLFHKLSRYTDGEGRQTQHVLDARGNRLELRGELGSVLLHEYDPDGFCTRRVDPDGRETRWTRSVAPQNPLAFYTRQEEERGYAGELQLVTTRSFDLIGNQRSLTDPLGNQHTYEYDALDRLVLEILPAVEAGPGGALTTSTREHGYTLAGQRAWSRDPLGNVTLRRYDLLGRIVEQRRRMQNPSADSALDLVELSVYDERGLLIMQTDPEGYRTSFEYDSLLRRRRTILDAGGLAYSESREYGHNSGAGVFRYVGGWSPTRVLNPRGFARDAVYDGFRRIVRAVRRQSEGAGLDHDAPAGPTEAEVSFTYDAAHNELSQTVLAEAAAGGDRRRYTFHDALHRPTVRLLDFDGDGNDGLPYDPGATLVDDAQTFVGHDGQDYVERVLYDLAGNAVRQIDREGHPIDSTIDGAGRITAQQGAAVPDASNGGLSARPTLRTVYDANSNPIRTTDARGAVTAFGYDARNRLRWSVLDLNQDGAFSQTPGGPDIATGYHYDLVGNTLRSVDARGFARDILYDRGYRQLEVQLPAVLDEQNPGPPMRPRTLLEHDRKGNVSAVIDPRGVREARAYDALDRLVTRTIAAGTADACTTIYAFDGNDNLTSMSVDNGTAGLQETSFGFDSLDRQTSEGWPGGATTTREYSRDDLLLRRTDALGRVLEQELDAAGRVVTSRFWRADSTLEELRSFTYDREGHALSVLDRSGRSDYGYDALYRLTQETRDDLGQPSYTITSGHDLNGNRVLCDYPDTGRSLSLDYDAANRCVAISDSAAGLTSYGYDANHNRSTTAHANGLLEGCSYDALDRLTSQLVMSGATTILSASHGYDLSGRRRRIDEALDGHPARSLTYDYDAQYRLIEESGAGALRSYTHDLIGNRLTKSVGSATTTYLYNARNEQLSSDDGGLVVSYTYDATGNRLTRSEAGGPQTTYRWDTQDRLEEVQVDGSSVFSAGYDQRGRRIAKSEGGALTTYRHDGMACIQEWGAGGALLDVEYVHGHAAGPSTLLYATRSATEEHFTRSAIGHTVALTDAGGALLESLSYEAFGEVLATSGASVNERQAYGRERDSSTGLDCHGQRYYDPASGRYLSRDPAGYRDGAHAYHHVANDPVNAFDPRGLTLEFGQKVSAEDRKTILSHLQKMAEGTGYKVAVSTEKGKEDELVITPDPKSKGAEEWQVQFIEGLQTVQQDDKYRLRIQTLKKKGDPWDAKYRHSNSANGPHTIFYDPQNGFEHRAASAKEDEEWLEFSPEVILGHELLHALHGAAINGGRKIPLIQSFTKNGSNPTTASWKRDPAEYWAMRIENQFRALWEQGRRLVYAGDVRRIGDDGKGEAYKGHGAHKAKTTKFDEKQEEYLKKHAPESEDGHEEGDSTEGGQAPPEDSGPSYPVGPAED